MNIRDARTEDREAIRDLTVSAYAEYSALMPYWDYYLEDIIATFDEEEGENRIVAEQDGVIVGSVLLYPAGTIFSSDHETTTLRWPEVRLLAVAPPARRQGVGAALMTECVRRAREAGAQFLTLRTNTLMRAAIHLYERIGFTRFPEFDFSVTADVMVRGYRLDLREVRE